MTELPVILWTVCSFGGWLVSLFVVSDAWSDLTRVRRAKSNGMRLIAAKANRRATVLGSLTLLGYTVSGLVSLHYERLPAGWRVFVLCALIFGAVTLTVSMVNDRVKRFRLENYHAKDEVD